MKAKSFIDAIKDARTRDMIVQIFVLRGPWDESRAYSEMLQCGERRMTRKIINLTRVATGRNWYASL